MELVQGMRDKNELNMLRRALHVWKRFKVQKEKHFDKDGIV
jgi:hypothetical protein